MGINKIRMGIVGAGTWGETHAAIYREHVLAEPVAICDMNEERARAVAEKYGVVLGIENVWNKFLLSPIEMRDLIDKVNSSFVGSYFDVGNVLYCGYPEHWINILGKRITKVHFKDYKREPGGLNCFVDLLSGDVDYIAVMDAFRNIGYDGWVTAEMLPPYKQFPEAILYNTSKSMDYILGGK